MRLVHLGDVHMYRLRVAPWYLMGKTLVGQANLWLNRRRYFDRRLLPPVVERIRALKPDLLLLSGDLTTTALPNEFAAAAAALAPLLKEIPAVAVPGNHDRYTFTATRRKRLELAFPNAVPEHFPHLQPLAGRWRLLALNSSVPRLWNSRGRMGAAQLDEARALVASLTAEDGLVVLSHYALATPPPMPPMKWGHEQSDAAELLNLFEAASGPVLFLHGHVHKPWRWPRTDAGLTRVIDVDAGAPCMTGADYPGGQGFWEIEITGEPADGAKFKHHVPLRHLVESPKAPAKDDAWAVREVL